MSGKCRLRYCCSEIPKKSFMIMVPKDVTFAGLLDIINRKQKDDYIAIFFEGSQTDGQDEVFDYWNSDHDYIFYASTTATPPSAKFLQDVYDSTLGKMPKAEPVPPIPDTKSDPEATKSKDVQKSKSPIKDKSTSSDDETASKKSTKNAFNPPNKPPMGNSGTERAANPFTPVGGVNNYNIKESTIGPNPHVAGIYTKPSEPRKDIVDKYLFCFTGSTKDHLLKGVEVDLDTAMNPNQTRTKLLEKLKDHKVNMKDKQLLIYLPGGLPFIGGTLGDIYLKRDMNVKKVIYGVLTRKISNSVLNRNCFEICNVSDDEHQLLISPLCDSSERGLSDIACLLGYLNHDGLKGDLLLKTCASTIHFPPLITSMNRIIERNQVVCRDVITVTSTLFTYFRAYLPKTCKDSSVFEYGLRMCNLISHIQDIPDKIPMRVIEVKPDQEDIQFLTDLKLGPIVYLWSGDIGEDFMYVDLDLQGEEAIENAYNLIASFRPIAPLSMRVATGCSIVKGKDHEYLYLMQSASKERKNQNNVDIIDPLTGLTNSVDLEDFAQVQGDTTKSVEVANLIDPERVQQIIMVNFDESKSMIGDLAGYEIGKKSKKDHRVTIAIQYLTAFANRTYGFRIPCIQGLVSFNKKVTLRCPLSPLVPDFEEQGLKNIKPDSTTKLWDSLMKSCEEIIKFRKDSNGKEIYQNAVSRILVISDGEDVKSKAKVEDVVKVLIKNKIIVDSVIISSEDDCKMLCAVCHATGGLAFRPENVKEGLSLFEQSAFLNYEERKTRNNALIKDDRKSIPARLKPEQITAEFMEKVKENVSFDKEVLNKELIQASSNTRLATPRHVCGQNQDVQIPNPRHRRILRELHFAAETNDINNKNYDPDMKIYTFQSNLDRWRVFLKGPEGTPYEGKWWFLYVTFPQLYPVQAPIFRFVSVPYHLNVSSEGRICLNLIEKGYISSKPVVDIIQEIKELFLMPSDETPIQIETYDLFKNNIEKYMELARESTEKNAKNDYNDYIGSALVMDDVPEGFSLKLSNKVPPYMLSQISGKPLQKGKIVMASSGVYYDRDELRQLVASNKNPVCLITGKILTERPEDLADPDDNDAI